MKTWKKKHGQDSAKYSFFLARSNIRRASRCKDAANDASGRMDMDVVFVGKLGPQTRWTDPTSTTKLCGFFSPTNGGFLNPGQKLC